MKSSIVSASVRVAVLAGILCVATLSGFAGAVAEEEAVEVWDRPEAPMLAELVDAGALPPVTDRLPDQPMVIEPHESIGRYGGEFVIPMTGAPSDAQMKRTFVHDSLVRVDPEWSGEYVRNLARDLEVSDDAREFTFYLREGMRWSDGEPYTADDIMFWYEDVAMNEELYPAPPAHITDPTGAVGRVEKVDDYTVRWVFESPHSLFLDDLAGPHGVRPIRLPKHYLSQFHIDYNPDAESLAREQGYDTWMDLIFDKGLHDLAVYQNRELPTIFAWKVVEPLEGGAPHGLFERNPYYWKVDTEGNQLPYMDRWRVDTFEDPEVILLRTLAGEVDLNYRAINSPENRQVLFDGREDGDYRFFELVSADANQHMIALNLSHQDEIKREIYNNKDFRIGLSHAMNREEIADLLYAGIPEPAQPAPPPGTPFYHERLRTQYIEHDIDLANEYLDRAGYTERDARGFRLGPDGERIVVSFILRSDNVREGIDVAEILELQWGEVGIDVHLDVVSAELKIERVTSNEIDAAIWASEGGLNAIQDPRPYVPYHEFRSMWAVGWLAWLTDLPGVEPIEPPGEIQEVYRLYGDLLASPIDEHADRMYEILDIVAEYFPLIGTMEPVPGYGTISNRIRNFPDSLPESWHPYPTPAPARMEQLWIDEE